MIFSDLLGGFAGANKPGKYCHLTSCKHGTYLSTITLTREAMNSKMAGEIWQRSRRILPAASSYIPDQKHITLNRVICF